MEHEGITFFNTGITRGAPSTSYAANQGHKGITLTGIPNALMTTSQHSDDPVLIQRLIDAQVTAGQCDQVNQALPNGDTALIIAARKGRQGIVKVLLENGAIVDHVNNAGNTAMDEAARNGVCEPNPYSKRTIVLSYRDTISHLYTHGASVSEKTIRMIPSGKHGDQLRTYLSRMQEERRLKLAQASSAALTPSHEKPPLETAVPSAAHTPASGNISKPNRSPLVTTIGRAHCRPEAVEVLLSRGHDANEYCPIKGCSALLEAINWDHQDIAVLLVENNATITDDCIRQASDVEFKQWLTSERKKQQAGSGVSAAADYKDGPAESPFVTAARGKLHKLQKLVGYAECDVNKPCPRTGRTAIEEASLWNLRDNAELLVKKNATITDRCISNATCDELKEWLTSERKKQQSGSGVCAAAATAVASAAHTPASGNIGKPYRSPLVTLIGRAHCDLNTVKELLERGHDANEYCPITGCSALLEAINWGHQDIAEHLVENNATITDDCIRQTSDVEFKQWLTSERKKQQSGSGVCAAAAEEPAEEPRGSFSP